MPRSTVPATTRPGYVKGQSLLEIARFAHDLKGRLDLLLQPRPGQHLLDVGCGPATDTLRLAANVAPGGLVVGVDADPGMIQTARARAALSPHAHLVTHDVADAAHLPYPANSFDGCRCERVLQHLTEAAAAVVDMVRVVRPGGVVVVADSDWASLSIHLDDSPLERRIVSAVAETFANGYAGRRLRGQFVQAGLTDVVVELFPVRWTSYQQFRATSFMSAGIHRRLISSGVIGRADWQRFTRALRALSARDAFHASATMVIASGVKRGAKSRHY